MTLSEHAQTDQGHAFRIKAKMTPTGYFFTLIGGPFCIVSYVHVSSSALYATCTAQISVHDADRWVVPNNHEGTERLRVKTFHVPAQAENDGQFASFIFSPISDSTMAPGDIANGSKSGIHTA